ncbi:MAG: hypothetical protein AAGJ51_05320 [Pseudomonadota bacterium]
MIFRAVESAANGVRSAIQIAACLLIGTMMVFAVGLPLLLGGRPEALIPLGLGSMALYSARKDLRRLSK